MHVRLAVPRDAADFGTIASKAMMDGELLEFLAPYRFEHPECVRQGYLNRARKRFHDGHLVLAGVTGKDDPWWDGKERIVGYLSAFSSRQMEENTKKSRFSWSALELQILHLEDRITWYTSVDRSVSRSAMRAFQKSMSGGRGPLADIKDYWDVDHLSIDPAFQGKGVGKMMMKHMQNLARKDQLPIVLVASHKGAPMYKKLGWVNHGMAQMGPEIVSEAMVWYPPVVAESAQQAPGDADALNEERMLR